MSLRTAAALAVAVALTACGGNGNKPAVTSTTLHLTGKVMTDSGTAGGASALSGAAVAVSLSGSTTPKATATSDADGLYSLDVTVNVGDKVVIRFSTDDSAPVIRTLRAAPGADVVMNATFKPLSELTCNVAGCATDNGGVALAGLPGGTSGAARAFNPVTEADQFPGDFSDSAGNLLVSGVFASFKLKDPIGGAVEQLDSAATVRMRVPRDTWSVVADITPGDDRIEVPLYAFDEVKGEWVRDGEGYLEDDSGNVVPESALAGIHAGTFAGTLVATGDVRHFSTWNVDWPIDTHGCVTGRIVDASGNVVAGATVMLRGVTYNGTSAGQSVGSDGRFCIDAMRSESSGEDIDNDGVSGEQQKVALRVVAGGKVYDLGEVTMLTAAGSCNGSGCIDIGDVKLDDSKVLTAAMCTLSGKVVDVQGNAVPAATIYSWDESIPSELYYSLCYMGATTTCSVIAEADASGNFTISTPILEGLTVFGMAQPTLAPGVTAVLYGERTLTACPPAPITLTLDQGYVDVQLVVSVSGNAIGWAPADYGAYYIAVSDAAGNAKWMVYEDTSAIVPPVTYGQSPAGATVVVPYDGSAPAALAPGDVVQVWGTGPSTLGLPYIASGQAIVGQ